MRQALPCSPPAGSAPAVLCRHHAALPPFSSGGLEPPPNLHACSRTLPFEVTSESTLARCSRAGRAQACTAKAGCCPLGLPFAGRRPGGRAHCQTVASAAISPALRAAAAQPSSAAAADRRVAGGSAAERFTTCAQPGRLPSFPGTDSGGSSKLIGCAQHPAERATHQHSGGVRRLLAGRCSQPRLPASQPASQPAGL